MIKRIIVIGIISLLFFFTVCVSSCRLGAEDCECNGLFNNKIINIPGMCEKISIKLCSVCDFCSSEIQYNSEKLEEENIIIQNVKKVDNSTGTGDNGYITVKIELLFEDPYEEIFDFGNVRYLTYTVKVYDSGELVGKAIVSRVENEVAKNRNKFTESYKNRNCYIDYINVQIENYIDGNYTFEIENIDCEVYINNEQ